MKSEAQAVPSRQARRALIRRRNKMTLHEMKTLAGANRKGGAAVVRIRKESQ